MEYTTAEFEVLYRRCFPSAMRMACGLLHDEDEARDVVHEIFLKLLESDIKMENPSAFILRAVRNASLNRINMLATREKIRKRLTLDAPTDVFSPDLQNEDVESAVNRVLTDRERQVVKLIYSEGLSYKTAADRLGISVASINKHVVGALKNYEPTFKPLNHDRRTERNIDSEDARCPFLFVRS